MKRARLKTLTFGLGCLMRSWNRAISVSVCLALVGSGLAFSPPQTASARKAKLQPVTPQETNGKARRVNPPAPRSGPPAPGLPNLDEVRQSPALAPRVPDPVPSTRRRHRRQRAASSAGNGSVATASLHLQPEHKTDSRRTSSLVRSHHVRAASSAAPALPQNPSNFAMARIAPGNRTGTGGEDLLSNNFNWNLPLVGLKGRGLDLGLTLSYNSLVWTRSGNYVDFDIDDGSIAPGFRLGFPTVEGPYYNDQAGQNFYLLVKPSGARVELRYTGSGNVYESKDSAHLQLIDYGSSLMVRPTDGTQMNFVSISGSWRCNQIKDRNGNFLTISYNGGADIASVTDTLGRVLTFNYDGNGNLLTITQAGRAQPLATFVWSTTYVGYNFSGLTSYGPDGTYVSVLTQVGLPDGSRYNFEYNNSYGMVSKIRHHAADTHLRRYTSYVAPASVDLIPRLTERRDWAENWNGVNGVPAEVVTQYGHDGDGACRLTAPDGTIYKEYYGSTWLSGLTTQSEVWSGGQRQKWTTIAWTQDNTGVSYQTNPRVTETNTYDPSGNRRRASIGYQTFTLPSGASCSLASDISEFAADAVTLLRRTQTYFETSATYLDRRIIGLPWLRTVSNGAGNLLSKHDFQYDWTGGYLVNQGAPVQHDGTNYGAGFAARGNLVVIRQFDVNDPNNNSLTHDTRVGYNTAGSVIFQGDASWHTTHIGYGDSFSDGINRNTFAYPTTVTDPDGFSSTTKYNFDFGAVTRTEGPPPAGQSQGAIQTMLYDDAGRIERVTTQNNGAYTRWVYDLYSYVSQFDTIQEGTGERYTVTVWDGAGRVRAEGGSNPGSTGGYWGKFTNYDVMGRMNVGTNPAEINDGWAPVGDDAAGWIVSSQTYDWKGRPLVTTNQDGTQKYAIYDGCGCAGGEVVTLTDEVGRQQKVYSDLMGRQWKSEVLNSNATVYSSTVSVYNALDQVRKLRQYAGAAPSSASSTNENAECPSGTCQESVMTFDGYARLKTRHAPQQQVDPNNSSSTDHTTWVYNSNDTVQSVTDARGASTTYSYNNRHLVTGITYSAPTGITATSIVSFGYDAVGNRTSMSDGSGSTTYQYNSLSQMTSEARTFVGLSGSYTLAYEYALSGAVKKVADQHEGTSFSTSYDSSGRMSTVSAIQHGGGFVQYASQALYRATGALKSIGYGNSTGVALNYNNRGLVTSYSLSGAKSSGTPKVIGDSYQYYSDGAVKFAQDQASTNSIIDRAYQYDHASRLKEAYSGTEARDYVNNTSIGTTDGPYRQSNTYDVWDNSLTNSGRLWSRNVTETASYNQFNRNPTWIYDAEGNLISRNETMGNTLSAASGYDAAGRRTRVAQTRPCWLEPQHLYQLHVYANTQTYDGDGQMTRHEQSHRIGLNGPHGEGSPQITYYLRSTVLGGRVISEYDGTDGQSTWSLTYVYAGNQRIGTLGWYGSGLPRNYWRQNDPVTGDETTTVDNGELSSGAVFDPNGVNVGLQDPFPPLGEDEGVCVEYDPNYIPSGPDPALLNPLEGGAANCIIDGIEQRCNSIGFEAAAQCPDNNCNPRWNSKRDGPGRGGWEVLRLGPNGFFYSSIGPSTNPSDIQEAERIAVALELARKQVEKNYDACKKQLKGSLEPGKEQTRLLLAASDLERVDPTLVAVSWGSEAIPPFNQYTDGHPRWNRRLRAYDGADVGPLQIANNGVYNKAPFTTGLKDPLGTFTTEKKRFDGNPFSNLRLGARAYTMDILQRYPNRAEAAGIFRAGTTTGPGYGDRFKQFNTQHHGYDDFFDCLKNGPPR